MSRRSNTPTPILPMSSGDLGTAHSLSPFRAAMRPQNKLARMVRRIFRPPTLDFETAVWEMFYLIVAPRRVYKSLYYRKQTKNTWARDDPSFFILFALLLTASAVAWGLAYSPGVLSILKLILYMVVVDFFAVGILVATAGWLFANRFLKQKRGSIGGEGELEWAYCFDVHCNSFLAIWVCLYVVQFVMLPLLTRANWLSLFVGNTLYLVALSYYFYITFLGYSNMPFLEHTELLLFPVGVLGVLYLLSLFGFNIARTMVGLYFA
ncbi:hypothetical protein TRVA0_003S01662 [Trichomonascus vanleenenianus]|uniref:Gmh1p n=1 Tax=Trichomonascus vanleenenianus TaxID=2268995 RepID=UPI003ECB5CB5